MDIFTMVIVACVAGEPVCLQARISETSFTSAAACEARIDAVTAGMTKELGQRAEWKGREVVFDVSCMDNAQMKAKLGVTAHDA